MAYCTSLNSFFSPHLRVICKAEFLPFTSSSKSLQVLIVVSPEPKDTINNFQKNNNYPILFGLNSF